MTDITKALDEMSLEIHYIENHLGEASARRWEGM